MADLEPNRVNHAVNRTRDALASNVGQQTLGGAIRVLFVGRKTIAANLGALFDHLSYTNDGRAARTADSAADTAELIEFLCLTNQRTALRMIRTRPPRVILVEVDPKPNSRVRFCEMVRNRLPSVAIFAVSHQSPQGDYAFDDVIELPLSEERVLAAIEHIRHKFASHVLQRGPIRLNVATRVVFTPNGQHHMTPKQCALLQLLMSNYGQVVSRSHIMESIWETSYMEDTRTLDVHIRWLRECIELDPSNPVYLLTVRGKGYHLCGS